MTNNTVSLYKFKESFRHKITESANALYLSKRVDMVKDIMKTSVNDALKQPDVLKNAALLSR